MRSCIKVSLRTEQKTGPLPTGSGPETYLAVVCVFVKENFFRNVDGTILCLLENSAYIFTNDTNAE